MFKPFKQTKVTIDNPLGRKYNAWGGPVDVLSHDWVHCNLRFKGDWSAVEAAFKTLSPFTALGWHADDCPTKYVSRWWYAQCPVSDEYMVSLETKGNPPLAFLQFVADTCNLQVELQAVAVGKQFNQTFNPHKEL